MLIPMTLSSGLTDQYLEQLRSVGDAAADEVIAALFAQGERSVQNANQFLRGLVHNDDSLGAGLDPKLRDFLAQTAAPAWTDGNRFEIGARLFRRHGPHMITLLNLYALPMTYTARKGVQVLARTNRLQSNAVRRITETAQMIIDVMRPEGLTLDPRQYGKGIRSAQKVRLLHAAIRHLILHHDPTWQADWGTPINQEDMAGTLLSFSVLILDGMEKLGVELSESEKDAYLHCWNVVGHFMGVQADLLVHDVQDAIALAQRIQHRQAAVCPEGQALTRALLDMIEHLIPGDALDRVPSRLMHFLIGEEAARLLALPDTEPLHDHLGLGKVLGRLNEHVRNNAGLTRRTAELLGRMLLQGLLLAFRGANRQPFDLPTELRQEWGLNWHAAS